MGAKSQRQGGPLVRGVALKGKGDQWKAIRSKAVKNLRGK